MEICNNNYRISQGHECLSSSIGCILGAYNQLITPNAIIILGKGLNVRYDSSKRTITSDIYKANYAFMDMYNIDYKIKKVNLECADRMLKSELKSGIIPILKLKSNKLNYSRVFSQATNVNHYVCITGYDENNYYICDNYVPTKIPKTYEGWVNKEIILKAFAEAGENYLVIKNYNVVRNIDIVRKISAITKESVDAYIYGGINEDIYYGKDAILEFFRRVSEMGIDNTQEKLIEYNFQLKIYGFISLKYILFDVLSGLISRENNGQVGYYIERFNTILEEWNNISMYMLKCGFAKKEENYKKLLEKVNQCNNKEIELLNGLHF